MKYTVLLIVVLCAAVAVAQSATLDIYVLDVEGGNATLFVSPSREAVLIDTGNGGPAAGRDAERIMAAVKAAGITQIDALVTSHWHGDHMGAMAELATRIPIRHFLDHGGNVQPAEAIDTFLQSVYPGLIAKSKHTVAKAGDVLPLKGVDWRFVTSARETITNALPGAGRANPHCAGFTPHTVNPVSGGPLGNTEDEHSVGSHITFGKFRALYLADFPWNKEFELMCPNNPIGSVDLFVVSHHGQPVSNAPVLVHALQSRVALLNNGTRKGGQPDAMRVLHTAPGLEDIWQVHFSLLSGQEYTVPGVFIANTVDEQAATMPIGAIAAPTGPGAAPPPAHNGPAFWIKVSAQRDGTFIVTNQRNGFTKTYRARERS
jgi:beta-lactamase superfamily II metal-dependent hydrolase